MMRRLSLLPALVIVGIAFVPQPEPALAQQAGPTLDYEFFRSQVQPIFLADRPGHPRCISCHAGQYLQPLSPGATTWNEQQSHQNFESVSRLVTPGDLSASRLLLHPLRFEAGGTTFHFGGKHWDSPNDPEWQIIAAWVHGQTGTRPITLIAQPIASTSPKLRSFQPNPGDVRLQAPPGTTVPPELKERIIQTNTAGDRLHIIDPVTDRIVAEVPDMKVPHGVVVAPDGSRMYVPSEADAMVDVVDTRTLRVIERVGPLAARPNNIATTIDGQKVYVAINSAPGGVDVIDTNSLTISKHIPLNDVTIHNPFVTPDGRHLIAASGSGQTPTLFVIDTQTDQILWSIDFPGTAIRPISFHTNPDGSTKWMFVNLNGLNGFVVVDFQTHEVIKTIQNPHAGDEVKSRIFTTGLAIPTHGVWVAPNQQTVWTANRWDNAVYAYSLPDLELMGYVPVGADPMWATFTADSKKLYVANNASGNVSVVDVQEMEEILRITVGQGPRRNHTALLPVP